MATMKRGIFRAFALIVFVALTLLGPQARAEDMSTGPAVTLAMLGPVSKSLPVPPLAEPVLLCGSRWVTGTYVLGWNCAAACRRRHSAAECVTLVPLCRRCWSDLQRCAVSPAIPPALRCARCSARYANCMWPFFH
jgi:hypothetical protein